MAAPAPSVSNELPADWRARLRRGLMAVPEHRLEYCRPAGMAIESSAVQARLRATWPASLNVAAVLVPIIDRASAPALLLTVRASHLRRHAGQISFPGGRFEAEDADVAAAAVRETREEIGIAASAIDPIGFLSDHVVLTGYRITPVVALLRSDVIPEPDGTEVAEVFELPLGFALQAANYRIGRRTIREVEVDTWELSFGPYNIWGATAGILANLREAFAGATA
jgi:8-oxo-dGTP pyrophosphatase MutT (NUDIX family)